MHGGGVDEEGGDDARADSFRRNRQRWEASSFKPAAGRHRGPVMSSTSGLCVFRT